MNKLSNIKWKISDDEAKVIRASVRASKKDFIGPISADNCWILSVLPDYNAVNTMRWIFMCTLNKWPQNIGRISGKCRLSCDNMENANVYREFVVNCQDGGHKIGVDSKYIPLIGLQIVVHIVIEHVYDIGKQEIPEKDWQKFNIF